MTDQSTTTASRSKLERIATPLVVAFFGTVLSVLMVVMIGAVNDLNADLRTDLRSELTTINASVALLNDEMVANRLAVVAEVKRVDDEIVQSIGALRADIEVTNQQLGDIDYRLSSLRQQQAALDPATDFSLSAESNGLVREDRDRDK